MFNFRPNLFQDGYLLALNLDLEEGIQVVYNAKIKNNLAIVYSSLGRFEDSLIILHDNLPVWEKLGFEFAIAQTIGNIAEIYRQQGEYNLAIEMFHEVDLIFRKHQNIIPIISSLKNIGRLHFLSGNIPKGRAAFEEAKNMGIQAVFEQKYGDKVSVYIIGDYSLEVCSGPHVENTSELGHFKIIKESSISAGVRRIRAILE